MQSSGHPGEGHCHCRTGGSGTGAEGSEYVTLTVVVRRGGDEGDPCDQVLDEHADVLFVGHQDGVSIEALRLGAEPGGWI